MAVVFGDNCLSITLPTPIQRWANCLALAPVISEFAPLNAPSICPWMPGGAEEPISSVFLCWHLMRQPRGPGAPS